MNAILVATKLCKTNFDCFRWSLMRAHTPQLSLYAHSKHISAARGQSAGFSMAAVWCSVRTAQSMAELAGPWNTQISFELTHKRMASLKMHLICTDVNSSIIHWYFGHCAISSHTRIIEIEPTSLGDGKLLYFIFLMHIARRTHDFSMRKKFEQLPNCSFGLCIFELIFYSLLGPADFFFDPILLVFCSNVVVRKLFTENAIEFGFGWG